MLLNGITIDDTFAEAFGMRATGLIITAPSRKWALQAATTMTGFGTSVIGCGVEAGIDCVLAAKQTPDGRPGVRVLMFGFTDADLQKHLQNRVGQCVLTSPGSACYAGLESDVRLKVGDTLRYFGDGWQISKKFGARHYWRIPVMDGEFVCEGTTGAVGTSVGGGNLLLLGNNAGRTLRAAEVAVAAMQKVPDIIMPFPGGIVRSGSKVGSKYKTMFASTNDLYCPTLKGAVATALDPATRSVLEIVIDGLTSDAVAAGMRAGIAAVVALGPGKGVQRISAGNYGGKLGAFHYHLKDLLPIAANVLPDSNLDTNVDANVGAPKP